MAHSITVDYPQKFRANISWAATYLLTRVTEAGTLIGEDLRRCVLHVLSFALDCDDAWNEAYRLLLQLTPEMDRMGQWRIWLPYLKSGLQRSQHFGDPKAFAELSLHLGIFLRSLAMYAEAEQWLKESLDGYVTLGERHNQGKALNRLAFLARLRGQLVDAERFANQALAILDATDDERALSYAILATVAYDQFDWSAAAARYSQALTIYEGNDNSSMAARVLADLAIVQGKLGEYEKATASFEQALSLLDSLNLPVQAAVARMNMGAFYLDISQPAQALMLYNRAEPVLRAAYDLRRVAYILSNQGIAHRDLDQLELSIQTLEEAIPYAQQTANYDLLVNTYDELGLSYRASGREACAQAAFQRAHTLLEKIESLPARGHYGRIITEHMCAGQLQNTCAQGNKSST